MSIAVDLGRKAKKSVAVSSGGDALLNVILNSSQSPLAEMAMSWVYHFSAVTP